MEQALQEESVFQRRYKEFKNDHFIKACQDEIIKAIQKSTPYLKFDFFSGEWEHGWDEESQKRVDWWKERISEHVKRNYSDLIDMSSC